MGYVACLEMRSEMWLENTERSHLEDQGVEGIVRGVVMPFFEFIWASRDRGSAHFGFREKLCNFLTNSATVSLSKNFAVYVLFVLL
jgi:hypothetical protein